MLSRRRALTLFGLGSAAVLVGCSQGSDAVPGPSAVADDGSTGAATTAPTGDAASTAAPTTATPSETGGPFPADGSNDNGDGATADVLHDPRAVRTDIRSDLDGSNTQDGAPLTLRTRVVSGGAPLAGAAVYVWHCNRVGQYSGYSSRMLGGDFSDRSYLRGVQVTDDDGWVTFSTILPGRYPGRAFHIHFEVYSDASYTSKVLTSQMAVDDDLIDRLYSEAGYTESLSADTDNARDNVFADGVEHQLLTVTGDVASGLSAEFIAVV